MVPPGRRLSSRNNYANLGFFAKVFVPVKSVIPWSRILGCLNEGEGAFFKTDSISLPAGIQCSNPGYLK